MGLRYLKLSFGQRTQYKHLSPPYLVPRYNYDKVGHKSHECKKSKKPKRKKEANMMADISKGMTNIALCARVSKVSLVGSNPKKWRIDTEASGPLSQILKLPMFVRTLNGEFSICCH